MQRRPAPGSGRGYGRAALRALAQLQDKLSAFATVTRLHIPQPAATVIVAPEALAAWDEFPIFLKTPIGTATSGVRRIAAAGELDELGPSWGCGVRGGRTARAGAGRRTTGNGSGDLRRR